MENSYDLNEILKRLAETIAWCRPHIAVENPKDCLRTPELQPSNITIRSDRSHDNKYDSGFEYAWGSLKEKQDVVNAVSKRREELLSEGKTDTSPLPIDLKGGKLLIIAPEDSDICGLSVWEAEGFIDDEDVPPWDTWVGYFEESITPEETYVRQTQALYRASYNQSNQHDFEEWSPQLTVSYILCWIPREFVSLVNEGVLVNPVECFFWAGEYQRRHFNTPLLRELDSLGLLADSFQTGQSEKPLMSQIPSSNL